MNTKTTGNISSWLAVLVASVFLVHGWTPIASAASGASLKITPASGEYEVGSTVDVSFILDTGGAAVNTVNADILFPADKLQVVNPAASTSFISLWVTAPTYSNTAGTMNFSGGLPTPGIKTSAGVISTVTFRIKAAGPATIGYAPSSKVLLNDGQGTNILTSTGSATFVLKTPPPAGPVVRSPTHGDTNQWYNNPQVLLQWDPVANALGYSTSFDQSPKGIPPDTISTNAVTTSAKATSDGVWYFHIKAKSADGWGGVTDFPVQIDITPPASFHPTFDQGTVTTDQQATLRWLTTDGASGIDHFEVKQVAKSSVTGLNSLFVETSSPYQVQKLPAGTYDFIVRAIDNAGNTTDATAALSVVAAGLPFYARTPLLKNPAVANAALIGLGLLASTAVGLMVLRRLRIHSTFQHDLHALEHDAEKKYVDLQRELAELQSARTLADQPPLPNPIPPLAPTPPSGISKLVTPPPPEPSPTPPSMILPPTA